MPQYLLDTDTVSFALRGEGNVNSRLMDQGKSKISISSITLAELRSGAARKESRRIHRLIDELISVVPVLPFDERAADRFGQVSSHLFVRGKRVGDVDTLIAAHALSLECVLVTHNVRHFQRIPGLKIEDWY